VTVCRKGYRFTTTCMDPRAIKIVIRELWPPGHILYPAMRACGHAQQRVSNFKDCGHQAGCRLSQCPDCRSFAVHVRVSPTAHHIDKGDAVPLHGVQVLLQVPPRQDAPVHAWMQRLHATCQRTMHYQVSSASCSFWTRAPASMALLALLHDPARPMLLGAGHTRAHKIKFYASVCQTLCGNTGGHEMRHEGL
jgi:hypothetical protein